jgi:hypothetical protein
MGKHSKTEPRVDPWKVLMESSSNSNSDSNAVSVKKTAAVEPKPSKKSKKDRNESVSSEKSGSTKKRKRDREDSAASSKRSEKKHKKAKSGDSALDDDEPAETPVVVQGSVKRAREQAGQGRTSDQLGDEEEQGVSFFELLRQEREADKVQETRTAERQKRNAEIEAAEVEALLAERAARKARKEEKKAEKIAKKEQEKREKKERKRKDRTSSAPEVETEGPPVSPFTEPKRTDSGLGSEKETKKSKRPELPRAASHAASVYHTPSATPRPETKRTVSDRASIAKVPAATEPAKGAEVLEKWNVGGLEGGSQRQSKFARLLGAKKQGIPVESGAGNGTSRQGLDQSQVTNDLEKQFEYGRKMKHESGGQKRGLGA